MQFVKDGPDVHESLIQAHEDGRVIFFCGAGISYPAGLPDFRGLVESMYAALSTRRTPIEQQSFDKYQYDATIDALERRYPGQRQAVRRVLTTILKPKLRRKGALATHSALVELGRDRKGAVRIVTTNFDRLFEYSLRRSRVSVPAYPAPLLPIPKSSRWNGIVYLHGFLSATGDDSELQRLVISSGDFGLAYLTERWAARFVSELFRNYVVCFVGYSINDPVLRYMMDALAADRMLGELTLDAYAFGAFQGGEESQKKIEWGAKGVIPILYEVPKGTHDHSALHDTLHSWAQTYRDGVLGRERIVVQHATARPIASTKQDDFVGRMLWCLTHDSGLPAKRFADFNPVPSLDWLEPLCDQRYRQSDLARFGVPPLPMADPKLSFSLAFRPAPYTRAPLMALVEGGTGGSGWDQVMYQLARWLARHLDDPFLIWWIADHGGGLNPIFADIVSRQIEYLEALEKDGKFAALDGIRAAAPRAVPRAAMKTLWRLIIDGRTRASRADLTMFRWKDRLVREGFTATLRLQLRETLGPQVALRRPFSWDVRTGAASTPERIRDLVDWEVRLNSAHARSAIDGLASAPKWLEALPELVVDFEMLVRDALQLMRELGEANEMSDRSMWDMPSIKPHWQNRHFRDWVVLVDLLRESWLALLKKDLPRAQRHASDWWFRGFPLFKRMALFAATQDGVAPSGEWVTWLLSGDGWWLWAVDTQREVMRLLVERGAQIENDKRAALEDAILRGLPRDRFRDDISLDDWKRIADRAMWLRLAKLKYSGVELGTRAATTLNELEKNNSGWKVSANERDEFSHWMSGSGDPDFVSEITAVERVPRTLDELLQWLRSPAGPNEWRNDDWRDVCRQDFLAAAQALTELSKNGEWPSAAWEAALHAWGDGDLLQKSWEQLAPVLHSAPDSVLTSISHAASWWLEAVSKNQYQNEELLWNLCRRMLGLEYPDSSLNENPVMRAINHPIGHLTQAILNRWFQSTLEDRQQLPPRLRDLFTSFCDTRVSKFQHARVLLAANVITIFRVDTDWATSKLLPIFSWQASETEALGAWDGFLWSPRLYRPLLAAFKRGFLDTAAYYDKLGESGRQYAALLTFAALDPGDTFTLDELRAATELLPQDGLVQCADALVQALEGAEAQRDEQWRNRVLKYWLNVWPKDVARRSADISEALARLAVETGGSFAEAVATLEPWLQPFQHPHSVLDSIIKRNIASKFPRETLLLLDKILADSTWIHRELSQCLNLIAESWGSATADQRYRRLDAMVRQAAS